ncbi:peptidoglycan-binding protein [bacterium]|nr:peptidoglycan-binding protein [bacterium]
MQKLFTYSITALLVLVGVYFIGVSTIQAATCTWTNGGADNDWNNVANWSDCGGNVPGVGGGVGDDVVLDGGTSVANVQLSTSDFNIGSLTMESDYTGELDFNGHAIYGTGNFTKVNGNIELNQSGDRLDFAGDFIVSGDAGGSVISRGNIAIEGDVTISGTNSFHMDGGNYPVFHLDGAGDVTVSMGGSGNYFSNESNRGELDIEKTNSTDTVTFTTDVTAWNVQIYEGELILNDNTTFDVGGLFIGQDGAGLKMNNATFTLGYDDRGSTGSYGVFNIWSGFNATSTMITGGTITVDGQGGTVGGQSDVSTYFASGCNWTPSGGTFQLIGDNNTDLLIDETTNFNFYNLTIGDGSNTKTVDINATSEGTTDINGSLIISANATLDTNTEPMEVAGSWTNSGIFNHNNNTVTFDGSGTQIVNSVSATTHDFYDVILAGTGTVQIAGDMPSWNPEMQIVNDLTISSGTLNFNNNIIDVDGDFNKTSGNLYMDQAFSALFVAGNFTISGDSGSGDLTDGSITIGGNLDISGDNTFVYGGAGHPVMTFDGTGDFTVSVTGANNILGTVANQAEVDIDLGTAVSSLTMSSDLTIRDLQVVKGVFDTNGNDLTVYRVFVMSLEGDTSTFNMASGTFTLGSDDLAPDIVAIWHQNTGATAAISGGTMTIEGPGHSDYGVMYINDGANFAFTGGTIQFIGDDNAEIVIEESDNADFNFYNLTIGDGSNSKIVDISTTSTINFDISNNIIISANATLDSNSEPIEVAGDWTNNGSFLDKSSTVTFDHADTASPNNVQTISGSTTFDSFVKDVSGFTNQQELHFGVGDTISIEGDTTLKGKSGGLLIINSSDDTNEFNIFIPINTRDISYLDVKNSSQTNTANPVVLSDGESVLTNTNSGWSLSINESSSESSSEIIGGGGSPSPPSTGSGSADLSIDIGQSKNIYNIGIGGINILAHINSQINFSLLDLPLEYSLKIKELDMMTSKVYLEFLDSNILFDLTVGETKYLDLDSDGINDIKIIYNDLVVNRIDLTIYKLGDNQSNDSQSEENTEEHENINDGGLVKELGSTTVYLIENGKKRPILNEYTFLEQGFFWPDIIKVHSLAQYPTGEMIGKENVIEESIKYIFDINLRGSDKGLDVKKLQKFLNNNGFELTNSGSGSPGNETEFFGRFTYQALIKFQNHYREEILTPLGLYWGTGYFGASTRFFVNSMYQ